MNLKKFDKNESIGYLSRKLASRLATKNNRAFLNAGYDVSLEQFILLVNLWEKDGLSQQDLAHMSGKDKTSVTRLVDCLEKRNMVVRVPDKGDRRYRNVYLTKMGRDLQEALGSVVRDILNELEKVAPKKDVDTCKNVLRKMIDHLGD